MTAVRKWQRIFDGHWRPFPRLRRPPMRHAQNERARYDTEREWPWNWRRCSTDEDEGKMRHLSIIFPMCPICFICVIDTGDFIGLFLLSRNIHWYLHFQKITWAIQSFALNSAKSGRLQQPIVCSTWPSAHKFIASLWLFTAIIISCTFSYGGAYV